MNNKLVFIIPARNSEKTIEATIQSILNQNTFLKFDILVIDNDSSDNTSSVCKKLGVNVIIEPKVGRSYARNRGIINSKSKWIAFIDSDVVLDNNWIKSFEEILQENFFDVMQGASLPATYDRTSFSQFRRELHSMQSEGNNSSLDALRFTAPLCNSASFIIRRESIEEVGSFDESFDTFEDADLSWSLWKTGMKFCVVPCAKSEVFWECSFKFMRYISRSFKMGNGFSRLMTKWGNEKSYFTETRWRSEYTRKYFCLYDFILQLAFGFGYLLQIDKVRRVNLPFHKGYYKAITVISNGEESLILNPYIRVIRNSNSLLLRDIRAYKNLILKLPDGKYSESEIFNIITKSLSKDLYNSVVALGEPLYS
jgi:glycosyltransferase involved in cell wall biosynthesis